MPNWVTNNIKIKGKRGVIRKLVNDLKTKETKFDFNAIIPMPKSLHITSGGYDVVSMYYAYSLKTEKEKKEIEEKLKSIKASFYGTYWDKIMREYATTQDRINNALKNFNPNKDDKFDDVDYKGLGIETLEDLGNVYLNNIINYGCDSWYDWACDNWGTKWNACNITLNYEPNAEEVEYWIDTAWSCPEPIIRKLVEKYDIELEIWYCDEDMFGGNYGHYSFSKNEDSDIEEINHDDSNKDVASYIFGDFVDEYDNENE